MFKYHFIALALKLFSLNRTTRNLYRFMTRTLGQEKRKRESIENNVLRGNLLVDYCQEYGLTATDNQFLELGTGWTHWYGLYLRLHYDMGLTLFDVWDNRQFEALQAKLSRLKVKVDTGDHHLNLNQQRLNNILQTPNFDTLYQQQNLTYVVESNGSLARFADNSFRCIFSIDVLEHVFAEQVLILLQEMYRLLKPGGYTIHQIGLDDHHAIYDRTKSEKQYMRYPEWQWRLLYGNDLVYLNRYQLSDWQRLIAETPFTVVDQQTKTTDITNLPIAKQYAHYSDEDLACTRLTIVLHKPI